MADSWKVSLCRFNHALPQCLISCLFGCLGVAFVQVKSFSKLDKPTLVPALCAVICCCIGTSYNRKNLRQHYKIKGNYFVDCILYILPTYACAAAQEYAEVNKRKEIKTESEPVVKFHIPEVASIDQQPQPSPMLRSARSSHKSSSEHSITSDDINPSEEDNVNESVYILFPHSPKNRSYREEASYSRAIEMTPMDTMKKDTETEMSLQIEDEMEELTIKEVVEVAVSPLDGNDPHVYSRRVGTSPYSFLRGDPYVDNSPPPTYLPLEIIKMPKATSIKEILIGMEFSKNGGLVCIDQEAINKQKGIVKEIIGSVIKNIASGLGAVSISLPVRIFEPRSAGERFIDKFSFANLFLNSAALLDNPVERLKKVMAFAVSGLYLGAKQEKPFNPLLGETFQGTFPDGTEIYVEHTSHNPPRDHFDIMGKGYRMWGYIELDGTLSFNTLTGEIRGSTFVYFNKGGQIIKFTQPKFKLGGMMTGDRTLNYEGEFEFRDQKNSLYGAIRIGDDKNKWAIKKKKIKKDDLVGKIWSFNYETGKQGSPLVTVYGSWLKKFTAFDDKKDKLWRIDRDLPIRHIPVDHAIPSDWRYREDLIWLSRKNLEYASTWKGRIEAKQRVDRQLRDGHNKKK